MGVDPPEITDLIVTKEQRSCLHEKAKRFRTGLLEVNGMLIGDNEINLFHCPSCELKMVDLADHGWVVIAINEDLGTETN